MGKPYIDIIAGPTKALLNKRKPNSLAEAIQQLKVSFGSRLSTEEENSRLVVYAQRWWDEKVPNGSGRPDDRPLTVNDLVLAIKLIEAIQLLKPTRIACLPEVNSLVFKLGGLQRAQEAIDSLKSIVADAALLFDQEEPD